MEPTMRMLTRLLMVSVMLTVVMVAPGYTEEWEKVVAEGFGDVDNKSAFPMKVFNNSLYVGSWNDAGTEVWMTHEGTGGEWNQVNSNGFGTPENSHSTSMEVFNDVLYVGVFNGGGGLWLTSDGTSWGPVTIVDFNADNICVRAMRTFAPYGSNQHLYIGTDNEQGAQVWVTSNGIDWLPLEESGFGDENNTSIYCMELFKHALYLGTANQQRGTQVWMTKGGITWTKVTPDGFGYSSNHAAYSMCTFKDYLYVGTVNQLTGTQVWRTSDGVTWYQSNEDGFGDSRNACSYCMTVFDNHLYVGTGNTVAQVWRTEDGSIWKQVNADGFGDSENRRVHSLIVFGDYLYAGTGNKKGTEIWRCGAPQEEEETTCFAETVFQHSPRTIDALRMMRDEVLGRSREGSNFIRLYYRFSPELKEIYRTSPSIRKKTQEVLNHLIPKIMSVSGRREGVFEPSLNARVESLLREYAQVGSPGLRLAINKVQEVLRNGNMVQLLTP